MFTRLMKGLHTFFWLNLSGGFMACTRLVSKIFSHWMSVHLLTFELLTAVHADELACRTLHMLNCWCVDLVKEMFWSWQAVLLLHTSLYLVIKVIGTAWSYCCTLFCQIILLKLAKWGAQCQNKISQFLTKMRYVFYLILYDENFLSPKYCI